MFVTLFAGRLAGASRDRDCCNLRRAELRPVDVRTWGRIVAIVSNVLTLLHATAMIFASSGTLVWHLFAIAINIWIIRYLLELHVKQAFGVCDFTRDLLYSVVSWATVFPLSAGSLFTVALNACSPAEIS